MKPSSRAVELLTKAVASRLGFAVRLHVVNYPWPASFQEFRNPFNRDDVVLFVTIDSRRPPAARRRALK